MALPMITPAMIGADGRIRRDCMSVSRESLSNIRGDLRIGPGVTRLVVDGDVEISENLILPYGAQIEFTGNLKIKGRIRHDTYPAFPETGALLVRGNLRVMSLCFVSNLSVYGNLHVDKAAIVHGDLHVTGQMSVDWHITVTGSIYCNNRIIAGLDVNATGTITVDNRIKAPGGVNCTRLTVYAEDE